MSPRVLLVDDEPGIRRALRRVLADDLPGWAVDTAAGAEEAVSLLHGNRYDAVVTDVNMPGRDGFALLTEIQANVATQDIPVIVVTGRNEDDLKRRALALGAIDLLNKPVHPQDLVARLRNAVRLKAYQDELRDQNALLEQRVVERTAELADSRLDIIWRLGKAAEQRDEQTGNHVVRVGCYSRALAEALNLDRAFVETLFLASPLHDIGKIGIPDSILRKRGPLTDAEREIMQQHCRIGADILSKESCAMRAYQHTYGQPDHRPVPRSLNPLLTVASTIALAHHERWDGGGYPYGLAGGDIPLVARIAALADAYDALRSERPYKSALPEGEVAAIIRAECGRHFDPQVCDAFARSTLVFRGIHEQFSDSANPLTVAEGEA